MKTIRLQNFRSLVDTTPIHIKPISILLGQNSSGKSTFIRSLPLLKQGLGVRTQGPFLWLGQLVDFGSFDEAVSSFSEDSSISMTFDFDLSIDAVLANTGRSYSSKFKEEPVSIKIAELRDEGLRTPFFQYEIRINDDAIKFQLQEDKFIYFAINETPYLKLVKDRLDVKQWIGPIPTIGIVAGETQSISTASSSFQSEILSLIKSLSHGKTATERLLDLRRVLVNTPLQNLLAVVNSSSYGDTQWRKNTSHWDESHVLFKKLRQLIIGARFSVTLSALAEYFTVFLYNTRYIKPLRASAERYYRKQGLAVDELDPEGDNFSLFLHNMSKTERVSFKEWSEHYFGIWIDVVESAGHLSLVLKSKNSPTQNFNMADAGFGYSQMFPILAQLWAIRRPSRIKGGPRRISVPFVFSIEQPELHLHPRLQAKLADVFVSAISAARELGIELRLIIETHSEYLVNRLGHLIATKALSSEDVGITIFEKASPSERTTIRDANFSEKGYLQNWPFGFFEPT